MKDITEKTETRRTALAGAFLQIPASILEATDGARATDKGNALEASRIAGIMAVKKTADALPFCHPISITHCDVAFELTDEGIRIEVTATTIATTGVEMEALYGASVAAMNLYDMLKPHAPKDTGVIAVRDVRLLSKAGGKSDYPAPQGLRAAILVTDEAVKKGEKANRAGAALVEAVKTRGIEVVYEEVVGNGDEEIGEVLDRWLEEGLDLVLTVGGTGLEGRDRTVEVVMARLEREIPGVMEAARHHGQRRSPKAMFSRGVAGQVGRTLVATFPGSSAGVKETAKAVLVGLSYAAAGL